MEGRAARFEEALQVCKQAGFQRSYAWTCRDYATTLVDSKSRPDRVRATELIAEALAVAEEPGMKALQAKLVELKQRISESVGLREPDALSLREVEVLGLIAFGAPNKAVAEQLFISPHTVVRHVAKIYMKIPGANNRAEAAIYAQSHGLVDGVEPD
jgi:DNA-binding NarL/FixJ family response regulator